MSGDEFDNVSPATGRVLGTTAAAGAADMDAADRRRPARVRRDGLGRNRALRKRCLAQLQSAVGGRNRRPARGIGRRGRLPDHDDARTRSWTGRSTDVAALSRPLDRRVRMGTACSTAAGCSASATCAPWSRSPSASSPRSPRRTYPIEVILNKLGPRWRSATPSCSSPTRTRRGTRPGSAGSSPSTPTSRAGVVNVVPTPANDVGRACWRPTRASTWCRSPAPPRSASY